MNNAFSIDHNFSICMGYYKFSYNLSTLGYANFGNNEKFHLLYFAVYDIE